MGGALVEKCGQGRPLFLTFAIKDERMNGFELKSAAKDGRFLTSAIMDERMK